MPFNVVYAVIVINLLLHLKLVHLKPNILMFVVDDLRPALGVYGDPTAFTPNIDSLAKDSIIFNNAYVQQALCAPSRNSFLTSRRPDSLHLYDFYSYWRDAAGNFTTLPQLLKESGYHTMSIGKIFHPGISSNYNDDQPYSWSEAPYHPPTEVYKEARVCMGQDGHMQRNLVCPVVPSLQPGQTLPDLQSAAVAKAFIKRHRKLKKKKPFFLAIGFHKPHVPLKFPMKYLRHHPLANVSIPMNRLRPPGLPSVAWNPWTDVRERDDIVNLNISFPFGTMPDIWTKLITQSYSAAVSYIDDLVGQIVRELDVTNQMNNTVIVLIGDHGWSLGEHGEWSKFSNLEPSVRVPFILHIPGVTTKGVISHDLVELVDLMPTLAQLAGIHVPQCLENTGWKIQLCTEGSSLVQLVEQSIGNGITSWKRGVFSQYPRPGLYPSAKPNSDKPHLNQITVMGYSLRTLHYRYTEWVPFHKLLPDWSTTLAAELYDHTIDPNEESNYYDLKEFKNIQRELSKQLRLGWRHSLPHKNVRIQ